MRIKKLLSGIAILCLLSVLMLPVQAYGADQSKGTTITTTVPDTHMVTLDIGEHGSVIVGGTTYTGIQKIEISRLAEQDYYIAADNGWEIDTVSYGGPDDPETVSLDKGNIYRAPALHEDGLVLKVTWKKAQTQPSDTGQGNTGTENTGNPTGTGTENTGNPTDTGSNVKTGDVTNPAVWGALLVLSVLLLMYAGTMSGRKTRKNS